MKDRIRVAALAAIVVVSSIILVLNVDSRKNPQIPGQVEGESTVSTVNVEAITLQIDSQTSRPVYTADFIPGESAYELLVRMDQEHDDLSFVFDEFSFGKFLTTINDIKADGKTQYWLFKVNDGESSVGVDGYQLHEGDRLSFVLTTVQP